MNGSMEKQKLKIPFGHHSISWNAIIWLYICIFIPKSGRIALFEHWGWSDTQRLCVYKLLRITWLFYLCIYVVLLCHKATFNFTNQMLEMFPCLVCILKILIFVSQKQSVQDSSAMDQLPGKVSSDVVPSSSTKGGNR